jgi:hypothetical protein
MPGAEALARRRQDDDPDAAVVHQRIESFLQRLEHLGGKEIHLQRTVHR